MKATVQLYLMTSEKITRLDRMIDFVRVPCVGEWLRFQTSGLLPHMVTEVTHNEEGNVEVVIGAQTDEDGKYMLYDTDEDYHEDINELVKGGWVMQSEVENRIYKNDV